MAPTAGPPQSILVSYPDDHQKEDRQVHLEMANQSKIPRAWFSIDDDDDVIF